MKIRHFILYVFWVILLIYGCSDDSGSTSQGTPTVTPTATPVPFHGSEYFPLQVGYLWQYKYRGYVDSGQDSWTNEDTVTMAVINSQGSNYFQIEVTYNLFEENNRRFWLRKENHKIFYCSVLNDCDNRLLLHGNMYTNETYNCWVLLVFWYNRMTCNGVTALTLDQLGTVDTLELKFSYGSMGGWGGSRSNYVKDLGLVYSSGFTGDDYSSYSATYTLIDTNVPY